MNKKYLILYLSLILTFSGISAYSDESPIESVKFITEGLEVVDQTFNSKFKDCPHVKIGNTSYYSKNKKHLKNYFCGRIAKSVVGSKSTDALSNANALSYKEAKKIINPSNKYAFQKYSDQRFLKNGDFIEACYGNIPFRSLRADECSENQLNERLRFFGEEVAVLMDSGGPHSIPMAAALVQRKNYTPVWKLGDSLHPAGSVKTEQVIASFKFHARRFQAENKKDKSPPVFILNTHRSDKPFSFEDDAFNNSIQYSPKDFPLASELKNNGIKQVIWITEGTTDLEPKPMNFNPDNPVSDPIDTLAEYAKNGITVLQLRIDPYACEPYAQQGTRLNLDAIALPSLERSSTLSLPSNASNHAITYADKTFEVEHESFISYHEDHLRYILDLDGTVMVINESGINIVNPEKAKYYKEKLFEASKKQKDIQDFLKKAKIIK